MIRGPEVLQVWKKAFEDLANQDFGRGSFDDGFGVGVSTEVDTSLHSGRSGLPRGELDGPIDRDEVVAALGKLKRGKACGVDGVVNEILLFGGEVMVDTVWRLCQVMFSCEKIPLEWSRGIIFPLYKDGDERIPNNYRGITLLSVVGKVYSSLLTKRLVDWCEKEEKLAEEQAGFRSNRSTLDHIFTLCEIIQARKELNKDTVCCFLDIKKAYDRLSRWCLEEAFGYWGEW